MQELKLVVAESDTSSLVLRGVGSHTDYFLPVTTELCALLEHATPVPDTDPSPDTDTAASATENSLDSGSSSQQELPSDNLTGVSAESDSSVASPSSENNATPAIHGTSAEGNSPSITDNGTTDGTTSDGTTAAETFGAARADLTVASSVNTEAQSQSSTAVPSAVSTGTEANGVEKKRRHRIKINMTPRTIQDRVRHGASVAELAKEADTDESRIEPYAWPILQERARIAELAHAAHPVSGEGPNKNTLWEVLATALAARGATLSDAQWDAHQDDSRRWIITVTWHKEAAGQTSTHSAEFLFEKCTPSPDLVHPHNSVASDLIDPRYGRPIRRMAAVTPLLGGPITSAYDEDDYSEYDHYDDHGNPIAHHPTARNTHARKDSHDGTDALPRKTSQQRDRKEAPHLLRNRDNSSSPSGDAESTDNGNFLLHPGAEDSKPKRKRKAVTPHWEDVLLGVRTNPRKKK
ncbi:septation protein SepH [Corynebacterium anserum]|uniref:DUF3071 domain-containing protein n=1 Tax=Corynebacterium anserum TaxID=2684406 RepID=A0A7G7YM97_9CORY|nr:septation protein SepH [Corynebacterium anserum]MBC2680973.1 DUF3071 domain-containing protein [Corynebacterium anserum]QNH95617.1 DUF3071 domain-containing protein [Corynebacterium anserum]